MQFVANAFNFFWDSKEETLTYLDWVGKIEKKIKLVSITANYLANCSETEANQKQIGQWRELGCKDKVKKSFSSNKIIEIQDHRLLITDEINMTRIMSSKSTQCQNFGR